MLSWSLEAQTAPAASLLVVVLCIVCAHFQEVRNGALQRP